MSLLTVSAVTKQFGPHVGVSSVSFELDAGESAVIVGANGAGKTTLIRMLASLSRPTEGEILLDGEPVIGNATARSRIGVVGHDTMLYDELTARENLKLHARLHGVPESRSEQLLETVGLATRGSDRVDGFSHGMQKRVSLARALLHDPDLLLFDEPYSGLDQASLQRITDVLSTLEDKTVIATTHDLERGYHLADSVLFLYRGQLVEQASTSEFDDVTDLIERYDENCRLGDGQTTPGVSPTGTTPTTVTTDGDQPIDGGGN